MRSIAKSSSLFLLLLVACFAGRVKFANSSIAVVGCILSSNHKELQKDDVEGFVVQKLINQLSQLDIPLTVLDRTKLSEIVEEHRLYLSGLVDTYKHKKELDLGTTDYLILARVSGFSYKKDKLVDDENMSESIDLFRGTVQYTLSFEMLNAESSEVVWAYSKDVQNADYVESESDLNSRSLLYSSLSKSLTDAFKVMKRRMRK